jgi:integrase
VLTDDDIRRLWKACATQNAYVCAWFRLRLVTAQRGGELLQMRWQDIDSKSHFWAIPAEFVKNAHGHRVYLNENARKLIEDVPRDDGVVWVFPKSSVLDVVDRQLDIGVLATRLVPSSLAARGEADRSERAIRSEPRRPPNLLDALTIR